jgi:hypothetical protein
MAANSPTPLLFAKVVKKLGRLFTQKNEKVSTNTWFFFTQNITDKLANNTTHWLIAHIRFIKSCSYMLMALRLKNDEQEDHCEFLKSAILFSSFFHSVGFLFRVTPKVNTKLRLKNIFPVYLLLWLLVFVTNTKQ